MSLAPFSAGATAAVVLAGIVAAVAGWRRPPRPSRPPTPGSTAVPWVVLAAGMAAWQVAAYVSEPRHDHPTLSSMTNALLDSHPARALAFVLWLAAAVHLARR